ncbi:MAG: stress response translation initiation inhibitor YciH [Calditrichaeota bacterium]|nr:MAG: stress response translation initiation inhibitor YciH [Calditrichota bacterium]
MSNFRKSNSKLVYSTDTGRVSETENQNQQTKKGDGIVRVKREVKGRKGKPVTTIHGIEADNDTLKEIASKLKRKCGVGGSLKNGVIEIQGDKRDTIIPELEKEGFKVKRAGG